MRVRARTTPRLRLTVGDPRIRTAEQQPAGHAGLTLVIGPIGAFAGIAVFAALGAPGIIAGSRGNGTDDPGDDHDAEDG